MAFSLDGKVAIVTGASRGMGYGIAETLAAHGADVVVAARTVGALEELAERIRAHGVRALVVPTDMMDLDQPPRVVDAALRELGRVDVLVNNAGGAGHYVEGGTGDLLATPVEAVDRLLRLNFTAHYAITRAAARAMIDAGEGGAIINITSHVAHLPPPNLQAYAAAKSALEFITIAWSRELGAHGIRVNAIQPGAVYGGNLSRFVEAPGGKERLESLAPLGRIGEPRDIAGCVLYLASDEAEWVTGASVLVSGGRR